MPPEILFGTGWRPDPPDERDLTLEHDQVREMLAGLGLDRQVRRMLPAKVDLRPWCTPVQYQGFYNTCTAHVVAGMIELLECKATASYVPASRLFLYQVAKRILGETGDPGVYLRQMMGAVVLLGVPPEKYWPYLDTKIKDDPRINEHPDAFCYALAREYGTAKYFRLDQPGLEPAEIESRLKTCLAASMPTSLGFTLYRSSLVYASTTGDVLFPAEGETPVGSHAILVVGYDDEKRMPVSGEEGKRGAGATTTGAFLFKNSWGESWGDAGYGWLPYAYLHKRLAQDCWTMMQARWIETDQFQLGLETPHTSPAPPGRRRGAPESGDAPQPSAASRRRASSIRPRSKSPSSQ